MVYGGSSSCLSLLTALLLLQKDKHTKNLTRLALPMVIFNINEVLTFGLLIMLNRILWIPFLPVPMVNFGLASLMLDHSKLVLHADLVHWTTPALIKVYWASEGNWSLVLLQLVLIILGAPLYWPFVQRFLRVTNMPQPIAGIHSKFNLADLLSYRERIGFGKKHSDYWNYRHTII